MEAGGLRHGLLAVRGGMRIYYVETLEDVTPGRTGRGCRRGSALVDSGKMIFRSRYKLK